MAKKNRRGVAEAERLKTLAAGVSAKRKSEEHRHDWLYFLAVGVWALLAALPSIHIGNPVPYMVGSTSGFDIHSRVEFPWHDALAENQALRNLEATYAWRYREEPLIQWAKDTHLPIDQFLLRAAAAVEFNEAEQAARELEISASREQLVALWRGVTVVRNDPSYYLVNPLSEILDRELFPRGILDPVRFDLERGRTIQILRGEASFSAMVGGDRGPTTAAQLSEILETRFRLRLSAWLPDDFKAALRDVILKRLRPSLVFDDAGSRAELDELRNELRARVQTVAANEILVTRGSPITLDRLAMLREEERVFRESRGWRLSALRFLGNFSLFAALAAAMAIFFRKMDSSGAALRRFGVTAAIGLACVWVGYWLISHSLPGTLLPLGLAAGVVTLGMNARNAIFLTAVISLAGLILFAGRSDIMLGNLAAGIFFASHAARCRRRMAMILVAGASGLIGAVSFVVWNFARGDLQNLPELLANWPPAMNESLAPLLAALGLIPNWLACGILVTVFIPLIERRFGVTTRITLQDLLVGEHPLLRRLIVEAPGTFHHCSIVATLAEAAAAAVGADPLRARVGGMFHDIGKLVKPEYFTENEAGISRHTRLSPGISTLIIINHVRDGVEMSRVLRLPSVVAEMASQHHGDSLMRFFHHKASQLAPPGTVVAREPFLYPGPKPQSPEAGVLMIADSVEAAARSLDDSSPQHMRALVSRLIRDRLIEGQFDECGLTMSQLRRVEEVIYRMQVSMYHTRVKYPGQDKDGGKGGRRR
ncbi:MAG: HDIG domain-containing protein [Planctomycetota bacterium]|jgi:putative nucleotidyltransferase with HDIG domain|nr:HDIG domain-containing protein [Planctomycetota bacterium]